MCQHKSVGNIHFCRRKAKRKMFHLNQQKKHYKMVKTDLEQLVKDYIEAWSTKDPIYRKQLIDKVYSPSADFYAEEPDDNAVKHQGLEEILGNITQVNERLVVSNGLITECTGYSENHNAVKVTWQMKTANGDIAMRGIIFLLFDTFGKIMRDYIFIS